MREQREELSEIVAAETGKSLELARGETDAAIEMGFFMAGEGRRFYGRTTTACDGHRTVMSVRQPLGVAGLLISFNTPLPNVAWKVFPAILCGNAACSSRPSTRPRRAHALRVDCVARGRPAATGVLNVVQGLGPEAGAALVEHPDVDLVCFTGSAETGRRINETAGAAAREGMPRARRQERARRLRRCRPRQRRALGAARRRSRTPASAARPRAGSSSSTRSTRRSATGSSRRPRDYDAGPVISEAARSSGSSDGRRGARSTGRASGWRRPCSKESPPDADVSCAELFGPVTILYRVAASTRRSPSSTTRRTG